MPIRNPNGRTWGPGSVQMEFRPGARVRSRRPEGHELPDCHLGVTPSMHLHSSILDQIHSLRIAVEFKSCKHVNMSKTERRQAREQVIRDLNELAEAAGLDRIRVRADADEVVALVSSLYEESPEQVTAVTAAVSQWQENGGDGDFLVITLVHLFICEPTYDKRGEEKWLPTQE